MVGRMRLGAAAVLTVCGLAASASAQTFRVARTYALSGSGPDALPVQAVLADVGSLSGPPDGHLDIVAVQQNEQAALLLGRGDGTFAAGRNTTLNDIPTGLAAGDFDGDTKVDLAVTGASKSLQIYRGTGLLPPFETFGSLIDLAAAPIQVATADLNHDGKLDLVVLNDDGAGGSVQVLLGNGDLTFTVFGEPFAAGFGVTALAIGDLTGDTVPDIGVTSAGGTLLVLRNNGSGFLEEPGVEYGVGLEPMGLVIGDYNGDSRNDVATVNRSSDSVSVLLGQAGGGFSTAVDFPSGGVGSYPSAIASGDFNKDGKTDLFVANNRSSDVGILLGTGSGTFGGLRAFVSEQEPVGVLVADLDANGSSDPVSVNVGSASPNVAVILSRADGTVVAIEDVVTEAIPGFAKEAALGGGLSTDILVSHQSAGPGSSGFLQAYHDSQAIGAPLLVAQPEAFATGDINGDSLLDVVAINTNPDSLILFRAQLGGGFAAGESIPVGSNPVALILGDWNGDGREDLATVRTVAPTTPTGEATGAIEVRASEGDSFGAATTTNISANPVGIDIGDFNEDRKLDLVVASASSAGSVIYLGNGTGGFTTSGAPLSGLSGGQGVSVADFDHDRHDDIAFLAGASDRKAIVLYGDGSVLFPTRKELRLDSSPAAMTARDLTGDGIADLLIADQASNSLTVYRSTVAERNFRGSEFMVSRLPTRVLAGDFDDDGRYDGAALTTFVGTVAILAGDSSSVVLRGDGNADTIVSAADTTALVREIADGGSGRIEDVGRGESAGSLGLDANGDGKANGMDSLALAHRLFNGI